MVLVRLVVKLYRRWRARMPAAGAVFSTTKDSKSTKGSELVLVFFVRLVVKPIGADAPTWP